MQPSHEERTLAALAHASIITNGTGLIGLVAAATIWATQRERSAYVRGHALQALAYQGMVLAITLVLTLSWGMCVALSLLPRALWPELYSDEGLSGPFWLALSGVIMPAFVWLVGTIYGIVGAAQAYRCRPFYYPLIGRLSRPDLSPPPAPIAAPAPPAAAIADGPAAPAEPAATPAPAVAEPADEPKQPARARRRSGDDRGS